MIHEMEWDFILFEYFFSNDFVSFDKPEKAYDYSICACRICRISSKLNLPVCVYSAFFWGVNFRSFFPIYFISWREREKSIYFIWILLFRSVTEKKRFFISFFFFLFFLKKHKQERQTKIVRSGLFFCFPGHQRNWIYIE